MQNRIIIPTGYMGSGSSAITDIIQEMKGYEAINGSYEYVFLHMPNGVFDLEDKLLHGNNALRSDEAIRAFLEIMHELYCDRIWWVGRYREKVCPDFWKITQEYVNELVQYRMNTYWYMQERTTLIRIIKLVIRRVISVISGGIIVLKSPINYKGMLVSLPTEDEFYSVTKKYIYKVFDSMGREKCNLILDQLLLPFNLWRMDNYFDDDVECFVVDRDPRDVFVLNKYIWRARKTDEVPFPVDVDEFCEYYHRLRNMEKKSNNTHVHRIHFEDLVYRYDESVSEVLDVLGLKMCDHIKKGEYFNPSKSINNTQLFLKRGSGEEIGRIESKLSEYIYEFPYQRIPDIDEVF